MPLFLALSRPFVGNLLQTLGGIHVTIRGASIV